MVDRVRRRWSETPAGKGVAAFQEQGIVGVNMAAAPMAIRAAASGEMLGDGEMFRLTIASTMEIASAPLS
jgi:hypothetical protein